MPHSKEITVYYDYEKSIGVNASCLDWDVNNQYFSSWDEFCTYLLVEYSHNFKLVEITEENYTELCELGVFNEA